MENFKKKSEAYNFVLDEVIPKKIKNEELLELQITYGRFAQWLEREYPGKTEWNQNSLESAIKEWGVYSWKGLKEHTGHSERTLQRYAVEGEDFEKFARLILTYTTSADQLKYELDFGIRGNRPKELMTDCTCPPNF